MKNYNTTFAIIAITAVAALLIVSTSTYLLTGDTFAKRQRASFHETASQSCVNQDARCQDLLSQLQGHDNSANLIGNQPSS